MTRVLFVCTGNICRSPTADGVFAKMVADAGLSEKITVDSCGTTGYHVGEPADRRATQEARKRGYDLSHLRARKLTPADFGNFDYLIAMDDNHLEALERACPEKYRERIKLFLDFHPTRQGQSVPDPYYGGAQGFTHVLDLIEETSRNLLKQLRQTHKM
ncbi:phosphotyrosine protein phosphatase [Thalassospira profundimaris]|uniref:protein-tyrosine-phosphatase n=1 Tax=Thalassospira profundimaris TaxID=502049 RepID=A0A367WFE8_9PROT|nr:low molecular weight protein-tyrosine-phosphatase [Thalassospira profundimaris]RCK40138.1 phosphotyrosine protein phosphatase [Thalassospira profundimaris]